MEKSKNTWDNNLNMAYVLTDDKLNILYCNRYFKKFIGGNNDEILNKKISYYFQDIMMDEKQVLFPVRYLDSSVYYVMIDDLNLYDRDLYTFFFFDFSMDSELEKQVIRLSRQQYINNEMFNKLNDGIYITDEDGTTLYVNDAFINLSGLTREQIIGKTVYELRHENILPESCCAKVIETKRPTSTINNYYKGQRCLVSGSPIFDEEGNLVRTIAVTRDVTELDILMKSIANNNTLGKKNSTHSICVKTTNKSELTVNNPKMKYIYEQAKKIASVDSTVLLLGETGVGKDFIATYIYDMCDKKDKGKFVKINCGAIPEHLLESEFFGYEKGAFTGAQREGKKGLFEEADSGILFLDEIGDMPYTLQVKLLSSINDKMFYRIGGTQPIEFNARIIAATNADLKKLVKEKKFRADLYYRINVVKFSIPPLRQRKEDIVPLAQQFIEYFNGKYGKNCYFTAGCLENLLIYEWPGNIREMKHLIERIVLMSDESCIDTDLFRKYLMIGESDTDLFENKMILSGNTTLKERMDNYEKEILEKTLSVSNSMKEAAELLGIDTSTLIRKKQKYNMN
jgi:PAS domain S-box-containing protein